MSANIEGAAVAAPVLDLPRHDARFPEFQKRFSVPMVAENMAPRYDPGDLLIVDPEKPVQAGNDVVIVWHDRTAEGKPDGIVRRLVGWDAEHLIVGGYTDKLQERVPIAGVALVLRIVSAGEVLGPDHAN